MNRPCVVVLWAMTLGLRNAFSGDINDPFLQAGTIIVLLFYMMDAKC